MTHPPKTKDSGKFVLLIAKSILAIVILGGLIFLLAGRLDYPQGWVLVAICLIILLVSILSFRNRKDLMEERRNPGPGVKKWDNIIIGFYQVSLYSLLIIAILDSGRFRWSPSFPLWLLLLAGTVCLFFAAIGLWALKTNDFFSSKVRVQIERNHRVVTAGPYRFVRHPGYCSTMVMAFCLAIILGSLWALVPATFIAVLFIIRTALEDNTLKKELGGYQEYAQKVRFRLIPGIW